MITFYQKIVKGKFLVKKEQYSDDFSFSDITNFIEIKF